MQIPTLTELSSSRTMTDAFGGYDHRARIAESSFYDMENMTGDAYPALSVRDRRGARAVPEGAGEVQALLSGPKLSYIAGNRLYVNDRPVMDLNGEGPKTMVGMGAYIVIFPDKVYYNTASPSDSGKLEAEAATKEEVKYTLCAFDGTPYGEGLPTGKEAPSDPENAQLWLDTSVSPPTVRQYSTTTGVWTGVLSTTVRVEAASLGNLFREGDCVLIDGIPEDAGPIADFNGGYVALSGAGDGWIAFTGVMKCESMAVWQTLTVKRKLPVLDHVFECGNRLWGCRYGRNAAGDFVNEIYASALGDFRNWYKYEGLSSDGWAATVGAAGEWTGGIAYQGMPHFFKDDILYRVYGSSPSAFRVEQTACRGVQLGAERSLQILNERLYYKSRTGVCVYDGAYPGVISEAFGEESYTGKPEDGHYAAAAGAWNNKYYISMLSGTDGKYHLFKFDAVTSQWYREDGTEALQFALEDGKLLFLKPDGTLAAVKGEDEGRVRWYAETGTVFLQTRDSGGGAHFMRYLSRITLQLRMEAGSQASVYIQYDGKEPWIHLSTVKAASLRSFSLPVRPRRCDHFRLKISGEGDVTLFSIVKTLEEGGETRV